MKKFFYQETYKVVSPLVAACMLVFICLHFFLLNPSYAEDVIQEAESMKITEQLGTIINLQTKFTGEDGVERPLGDFIAGEKSSLPIIFAPVYYECPRLCNFVLNGVSALIKEMGLAPGKDYRLIAISFNPEEGPRLARAKGESYRADVAGSNKSISPEDWQFLTGTEENIRSLLNSVGFGYKKDAETGEFLHAAALIILSPKGKVSRYFYGVLYPEADVRFSLVEAAEGRIGNTVDKVMFYCFRFDPTKGKYTLVIMNIIRGVSLLFVLAITLMIFILRQKEKKGRSHV